MARLRPLRRAAEAPESQLPDNRPQLGSFLFRSPLSIEPQISSYPRDLRVSQDNVCENVLPRQRDRAIFLARDAGIWQAFSLLRPAWSSRLSWLEKKCP